MVSSASFKVDFLVLGAARSATTSISTILARHPDICFSQPKEPQFFSQEDWRNHLDSYKSLFKKEARLYGEGSTNYTKFPLFNPKIHNDIYEYNPNMKLIYIMRHPIDRIISHYKFAIERGYSVDSIDIEILKNPVYLQTVRGKGYIWSKAEYENFDLTLSYKLSEGANSGVFYRVNDKNNPVQDGLEVQLMDNEGFQKTHGKKDAKKLNGS